MPYIKIFSGERKYPIRDREMWCGRLNNGGYLHHVVIASLRPENGNIHEDLEIDL